MAVKCAAIEFGPGSAADTRSISFLFLPAEHDPDSFVRERGAKAFADAVAAATPLSSQLLALAAADCDLAAVEGRARMLAQARPLWTALPDGALKRQLLPELARAGHLQADDVLALWGQRTAGEAPSSRRAAASAAPSRPRDRTPGHTRRAPAALSDLAVRLLLVHSEWWERLGAEDHQLLHELGAPHSEVMAWLERQITEHGAQAWGALAESAADEPWRQQAGAWVERAAVEDQQDFAQLQAVLHRLWIERLEAQSSQLAELADVDSTQRQPLLELRERIKRHRHALSTPAA